MAQTEAPSNWLSKIIEEKRRTIDRAFPRRERKAACTSIVVAIQANPNGAALVANPTLHDVVLAALDVAAAVERAMERDPHLMTASPAMQASWYIFDKLGLEQPDPEF